MLVYLIAAVEALGYLSAVPVCVAFWLEGGDGLHAGVGAGTFDARAALRRAIRQAGRKRKKRRGARIGFGRGLRLFSKIKLERFVLRGRLGLGDAAATAVACGGLNALGASLRGRVEAVSVDVAPAFDADAPRVEIRGMVRARAGQIMIAAARSGFPRQRSKKTGGLPHGKAPD